MTASRDVFERHLLEALRRRGRTRDAYLEDLATGLRGELVRVLDADVSTESFLREPAGERLFGAVEPLPPARLAAGDRVGRFRVLRPLGCGGMSEVVLAVDDAEGAPVALKAALGPAHSVLGRRLLAEAEILRRFDHAHIVRALDHSATDDGRPVLVLEAIVGNPLDIDCEATGASLDRRLRLVAEVCVALRHVHQRRIVHCDVKPANVLVTVDGAAKLLDFGAAKILGRVSSEEARAMTLGYAGPSQIRGEPARCADDIYGLGVLLYQLVSGRLPYGRGSRRPDQVEALWSRAPAPLTLATGLGPRPPAGVLERLDRLCAAAVAVDGRRRRPSIDCMLDELQAVRAALTD
ncbi:MAG: serine/threonine-protein kinase [Acidobacteriota bacterium]